MVTETTPVEKRENICWIIIGRRRVGKSTFIVNEIIPLYLAKNIPVYILQGKRNETYDRYKDGKNVHIYLVSDIAEKKELLASLYNACVIIDDAQLLINERLDDDIRKLIINLGQVNCDTFLVYHSFTDTTKELFRKCDGFEIFHTLESAAARRDYLTPQQIAEIDGKISGLKKYEHFTYSRY